MAELHPNVRLNLANTAENVVLVREMLSGVAEAIELRGSELNDVRTAVTEACNNVVLHAYEGARGSLEVEVCISAYALFVVVRDQGTGIQARPESIDATTAGIGLHVIRTLTHRVEFIDRTEGGTEVRMEFAPSTGPLKSFPEHELPLPTFALADSPTTTTTFSIAPIRLARTVLPRIVSALAARAHFSTDRISDVQLLADSLVAHAPTAMSGDHLSVDVSVEPRELELRIAPLETGHARRLIGDSQLDGLGSLIEKLTDRRDVASAGCYETLTLGLVDRR
jgi:anti-sigma regulatory factor (Ser/Thr protein kinase)